MNKTDSINQLFPETYVNINGSVTKAAEAKISIFDRGFLYGDSVYEVTYSENNSVLFFDEHLDRLFNSAHLLDMNFFISREEIIKEVLKTLSVAKIARAYIRIIVTRGETQINLDPSVSTCNNLVIIVRPQAEYPPELYEKGLNLAIVSVLRNDKKSTDPNAKSGNYLNNVMAMAEAKRLGAMDAIMVNQAGNITEGSTFNIWAVKNGNIHTPPLKSGLLKGITRAKVIEICQKNDIPIIFDEFTPDFILNADEAFITSSTKGIMPIYKINEQIFGKGIEDWTHTQKLMKLYKELIKSHQHKQKYCY